MDQKGKCKRAEGCASALTPTTERPSPANEHAAIQGLYSAATALAELVTKTCGPHTDIGGPMPELLGDWLWTLPMVGKPQELQKFHAEIVQSSPPRMLEEVDELGQVRPDIEAMELAIVLQKPWKAHAPLSLQEYLKCKSTRRVTSTSFNKNSFGSAFRP